MSIKQDILSLDLFSIIDLSMDVDPSDNEEMWKEFYLETIENKDLIDEIFIETMKKHNLTWKDLYNNRKSGFIYDFNDAANLYFSWCIFNDATSLVEWRGYLTQILARISYFDQDLFKKLFPTYINKGKGLSNLIKFTHILQNSLSVYAINSDHKRFIDLLRFIIDEYTYSINKDDISDDIVAFICALVYGNNYSPILIDTLLEISEPFHPRPEIWKNIIIKVLRDINLKMRYIASPLSCINYILFGIINSFESKIDIVNAYSKAESEEIFSIIANANNTYML